MEQEHTKRGRSVVYRPVALRKRRAIDKTLYSDNKWVRRQTSTEDVVYKESWSGRVLVFESISTAMFFSDYRWDVVSIKGHRRGLDVKTRVKYKYLLNRKHYLGNYKNEYDWRYKCNTLLNELTMIAMELMVSDMIANKNSLVFPVYKAAVERGAYRIGFFRNDGLIKLKSWVDMNIVPHGEELLMKWYPVAKFGFRRRHILDNLNVDEYERVDVQERIAKNNRLNGFGRRFFQRK